MTIKLRINTICKTYFPARKKTKCCNTKAICMGNVTNACYYYFFLLLGKCGARWDRVSAGCIGGVLLKKAGWCCAQKNSY